MFNDLSQLHNYLKERGIQTNIETFYNDQLLKVESLPPKSRDLLLAIFNRHPHFPDQHGFYQGQPIYLYAVDILQEEEGDGNPIWAQADFAALWTSGVLAENWRMPTERRWADLDIHQKLGLLQLLSLDWVFQEAQLLELVEFSDVYFYTGFFEQLSLFFADAIDAGDKTIAQKVQDTLVKQAAEGVVARNLVKACLICEDPSFWTFMAKLLVAAEQQEAIRQIIVKEIPSAAPEARILLLETLLEHDLQRFEPVTYELNQWFQLPLADGVQYNIEHIGEEARIALRFLKEPGIPAEVITQNTNLTEAYFALWALNIQGDKRLWDLCNTLLQQPEPAKRALALYALLPKGSEGFELALPYLKDQDWSVRWNLYKHFQNVYFTPDSLHLQESWAFFEDLVQDLSGATLKNPQPRFSWDNYHFDLLEVFNFWIYRIAAQNNRFIDFLPYRKRMDANLRSGIFSGHFQNAYQLVYQGNGANFKPTEPERQWILETIQDASANVSVNAFVLFAVLEPRPEELEALYKLLSRKTESVRKNALAVLFKLPEDQLKTSIVTLLNLSDEDQQLAGLDLLQQLKNQRRLPDFIKEQALAYSQRPNIGTKAELILQDLLDDSVVYDFSNGYGLYDPNKARLTPVLQKPDSGFFVEQMLGKPMLGLSISLDKLKTALQKLDALFTANEDYTYVVYHWDNSTQVIFISNPYFQRIKHFNYEPTYAESIATLPLPEVWETWLQESGLNAMDRYLLTNYQSHNPLFGWNAYPEWLTNLAKQYTQTYINPLFFENQLGLKYPNHCHTLLGYLRDDASIQDQIRQLNIDAATHYFASIPPERLHEKFTFSTDNPTPITWRDAWSGPFNNLQQWEYQTDSEGLTTTERLPDAQFRQYWTALYWFYCQLEFNQTQQGWNIAQPPTLGRAYQLGLISKDEAYEMILSTGLMGQIYYLPPITEQRLLDNYPFFKEFYAEAIPHFLTIELERGDSPTAVSEFVAFFKNIYGVDNFLQIVKGLGEDALHRGYSWGGASKKMQFSRLLKNCSPAESETYEDFKNTLAPEPFSEKRLLQVSLYAPQWLTWMAQYLDWPGLESAAWCLHAHGTTYLDLEKESKLAQYTSIPIKEFKYGAVDIQWFKDAFSTLGAARWEMVYAAAHYICQNQGYIRARLYADGILGNLSLETCKKQITEKRNKDYVVALGLIPLLSDKREQDILDRYLFLQEFLDEGMISVPKRQSSEKRSCDISLENLARNAGYLSPVRLIWSMEILALQQLMAQVKTVEIEGYTAEIQANELGSLKVVAIKDGKVLGSLPDALKMHPLVLELIAAKNNLNKQRKRIFQELEEAMILSDGFLLSELQNLMAHPVLEPLLRGLVLISGGKTGFFRDAVLENPSGTTFPLSENEPIRIAHSYDLAQSGEWSAYQSFAFEQNLVQPFKQIFRELYLPNEQEINAIGVTQRYEGYKVQPTPAAGIFRARGWSASYYEGMQTVYHRYRIVATVEAYADWLNPGGSPLPVEIHAVRFYRQLSYEALPLKELPPAVFSEVMRDLDLIVTVAQAAGVEVMAGRSTLELRAILVMENVQLRGLDNVRLNKDQVQIQSASGTAYTVHLNSAAVYVNDTELLEINLKELRGSVFLPFAEKDEKALEVVKKVVYLAGK